MCARASIPAVVDADALNLLAENPVKLPADWIITPHPGEAARLLGIDTGAVQADRLGAARELHARYGAVTVLKGAGTLVVASGAADAPESTICERGNPGMATAGMGDVLTGVIAGLRAQMQRQRRWRRAWECWCTRLRAIRPRQGRATARAHRQRRDRRVARLGESVTADAPRVWLTRSPAKKPKRSAPAC